MSKNINIRIAMKRDTEANWTSNNPTPLNGEVILVDIDDKVRFKVGDGRTDYNELPFSDLILGQEEGTAFPGEFGKEAYEFSEKFFIAEYGKTTFNEVVEAYSAGKIILGKHNSTICPLTGTDFNGSEITTFAFNFSLVHSNNSVKRDSWKALLKQEGWSSTIYYGYEFIPVAFSYGVTSFEDVSRQLGSGVNCGAVCWIDGDIYLLSDWYLLKKDEEDTEPAEVYQFTFQSYKHSEGAHVTQTLFCYSDGRGENGWERIEDRTFYYIGTYGEINYSDLKKILIDNRRTCFIERDGHFYSFVSWWTVEDNVEVFVFQNCDIDYYKHGAALRNIYCYSDGRGENGWEASDNIPLAPISTSFVNSDNFEGRMVKWENGELSVATQGTDFQPPTDFVAGKNIYITTNVVNGKNEYCFSHEKEGPSGGYTSGNTMTLISGSGASGTIKIPQITVDEYGHVTASADENIAISMPIIPNALKNPESLTVGEKTYDGSSAINITAADLGLASAMKFLGTSTTVITDGATTNPIIIGDKSITVTSGNVVLYSSKEFVWNGSSWEELGSESSYKLVQSAVASPSTSGTATAFIDTISQNEQGVITVTKKNVCAASTSAAGLMSADDKTKLNKITFDGQTNEFWRIDSSGNPVWGPIVRGTDYWTEEDKNEIKQYVEDAILGGAW